MSNEITKTEKPEEGEEDESGNSWLSEFLESEQRHHAMEARRNNPHFPHTDQCREQQLKWPEALAVYERTWPNYCRTCGANGVLGYFDDVDNCPDCFEKGLCPRCGAETFKGSEDSCEACNWEMGDSALFQPECECPVPESQR